MMRISSALRSSHPLYKQLTDAAQGFKDYNFRSYFMRKVQNDWREAGDSPAADFVKKQEQQLDMLKRQSVISDMYPSPAYKGTNKE